MMASSVARMPADEWRAPGRLAGNVLGAHAHHTFSPKNLRKVLVREQRAQPKLSSSSSSSSSVVDQDVVQGEEPSSLATRRRQSQILDRWAARRAREMITTIERQAHEAEISALSTTSQPVSARAASFLRETSPALSDASSVSCGGGGLALPSNVRASSLIQMWRELEAESGATPTHRNAVALASEPSVDDSEPFGEWDSDHVSTTSSERGRVGNIVKMLTSGNAGFEENDGENPAAECSASPRGTSLRVRGRREIEDLIMRIQQERRRELEKLVERQPVSRFSHRGRIQSMLKFMSLRRELATQDQPRPASRTIELDQLQKGANIMSLRQRFNHRGHRDGCGELAAESSSSSHIQFPDNARDYNCAAGQFIRQRFKHIDHRDGCGEPAAEDSSNLHTQFPDNSQDYNCSANQFTRNDDQYQEPVSPREPESESTPEVNSPRSRSEDLQEGIQSIDGSWDERNLWVSNLDWQRPMDSLPVHGWQCEVVGEDLEPCTRQDASNTGTTWISDSPNSWRALAVSRQSMYHDLLENYTDNVEIRELLERRRVSTSLASGFREKMNRLIISFLQRQGQHYVDENIAEDDGERFGWRQNDDFQNADQIASSSSSLIPLPCQTMYRQENWQEASSYLQSSSQHLLEMEVVQDLRSDMAQLHHEIYELRKLVESCMDWQGRVQNYAEQDVSGAVHQSGEIENGSKWAAASRKGSCCICCEVQVDSLLYRCGHMCTCFKCAHELQWSSGRCPICRAPILDVVRAFSNS